MAEAPTAHNIASDQAALRVAMAVAERLTLLELNAFMAVSQNPTMRLLLRDVCRNAQTTHPPGDHP